MKKGQRATHRVRYIWENGIGGTIACLTADSAEFKADQIRGAAEHRDMAVTVTIEELVR